MEKTEIGASAKSVAKGSEVSQQITQHIGIRLCRKIIRLASRYASRNLSQAMKLHMRFHVVDRILRVFNPFYYGAIYKHRTFSNEKLFQKIDIKNLNGK